MRKFIFLTDLHYGFERKSGHKVALHDQAAMRTALAFANDFQPDVLILGGDMLDCGCISHHNHNKPGRTESMRLLDDAKGCRTEFIEKLPDAATKVYIQGNHEAWLQDFEESFPAVEGMFSVDKLLGLDASWHVLPVGGQFDMGHLTFVHGDQLSGGDHVAKAAVLSYNRNVRFGHFHSAQLYSKNTPTEESMRLSGVKLVRSTDNRYPKTGMGVGCLCKKSPHYGRGKPNRWNQGFLYGYVMPDGSYFDYPVTIINGQTVVDGKMYTG